MKKFNDSIIKELAMVHKEFQLEEMIKLEQYFRIHPVQKNLKDFNRV